MLQLITNTIADLTNTEIEILKYIGIFIAVIVGLAIIFGIIADFMIFNSKLPKRK